MKHLERFKQRVLKRSSSPAGPKLNESSLDADPTDPVKPSQPRTHQKYGLFEFKLDESRPQPAGPERFPIDIIAVHGLNGDAYGTWTHSGTGKIWLRDFIPEFLPGSRVYTFGYPSKLMDVDTRARVQEFGRKLVSSVRDHLEDSTETNRRIIFVCHSLGGIVCKQALVYAHEDEKSYSKVLESTTGIIFLATPHRGSDTADFAKVISTIINTCMTVGTGGLRQSAVRTELLEYLGRDVDALQDLIISVRHRLQNLSIVTFYENRVMANLPSLIVDRASAELGLFNEEIIPLWEDHKTISRFESDTSPSYLDVARALRRIARQPPLISPALHRASTHSSNKIYNDAETTCMKLLNDHNVGQHEQTPPKPVAGTCQWIHAHQSFVAWLEKGSNAVLWLTGQAGSGKTTLSYSLAQYFSETGQRSRTVLVYFCQNRNQQTDAKAILIGLILQIIGRHRSMIDHVRKMYDLQRGSIVQSFPLLWNLFLRILRDPKSGSTYVILDALDECEQKSCHELLNSVSDMLSSSASSNHQSLRVKFLLTSRPFLHQSYAAKQALRPQISIDDNQPGYTDDIRMFIQERVDEISQNRQFPTHIRDYLYQSMVLKADQTFLWIQVVLASLEKSLLTSKTDLQGIISSIPEDLANTYMRYMVSIPSQHQDEASRLLKLLLASSRPLHLDELNIAFTLKKSHSTTEDVARDLQNAISHTVQGILGPLVRVAASQVSLIHHSVKEFLLKQATTEQSSFSATGTVNTQTSAMHLARVCIQYLLLDDFQVDQFSTQASEVILDISDTAIELPSDSITGNIWDDEDHNLSIDGLYDGLGPIRSDVCKSIATRYPFYSYAALHWAQHLAICEDAVPPDIRAAAQLLLDADTAYCRNWLSFYHTQAATSLDDDVFGHDPVILASQFNLDTILQELLDLHELSQAIKDRSLYWASRLGHGLIVTSMLRAGGNSNSKELERQTALTIAAEQGHFSCVISLLANRQTDINMPGRSGRTALSYACGGGYNDIVKHLLDHRACKRDEPDDSGATPFFWAAGGGHESIMLILARCRNVDINHRDKSGRTAVSWAAGDGMSDVLTVLLKFPYLDVNLADNKGRSPLLWAAGNGRANTVELLLKSAAVDIGSIDNDKRNAISWACGGGHHEVLVKLLDRKCPGVDIEDIDGWAPLAWAIETDSPHTVQALIDSKQVDIERRDRGKRTALAWAIAHGHPRVIDVLLRAGAIPES